MTTYTRSLAGSAQSLDIILVATVIDHRRRCRQSGCACLSTGELSMTVGTTGECGECYAVTQNVVYGRIHQELRTN